MNTKSCHLCYSDTRTIYGNGDAAVVRRLGLRHAAARTKRVGELQRADLGSQSELARQSFDDPGPLERCSGLADVSRQFRAYGLRSGNDSTRSAGDTLAARRHAECLL